MTARSAFARFVSTFALAASLVAAGAAGAETVIVVPNSLTSTEGNNGFKIPFGFAPARYQQIQDASEFGDLLEPGIVSQIAMRVDANRAAFSMTIPSVEIRLSTTDAAPNLLSGTFADNHGLDETVVYTGSLDLGSSVTGAGPRPFDLVLPITEPFLYDPAAGNLLFDIQILENPNAALAPFFDGASVQQQVRVFCQSGCDPGDEAGQVGDGRLVLQFTFAAPEAGGLASGAAALLGLGALRRRAG